MGPKQVMGCTSTKMDEKQLIEEGIYNIFGVSGARTVHRLFFVHGNQAEFLQIQQLFLLQQEISQIELEMEQMYF